MLRPESPAGNRPITAAAPIPPEPNKAPSASLGKASAFAALSAGLLQLAVHPFNFYFMPFVALVPWLWGLRRCSPRQAFIASLVFGTLNSLGSFYFLFPLRQYHGLILLGLPFMLLFYGAHVGLVGALMVRFGRSHNAWIGTGLGMLAWGAMEWFKGTGKLAVPIGFLGHGALGFPLVEYVASIGGVPLLSALVVGVNLGLFGLLATLRAREGVGEAALRLAASVGVLVLFAGWGSIQPRFSFGDPDNASVRVAVVQPNVPQPVKFRSYSEPDAAARENLQIELATELLSQIDTVERGEVDIVVTPESAFSTDVFDRDRSLQKELQDRANDLGVTLLVGALDVAFATPDGGETDLTGEAKATAAGQIETVKYYNALWAFAPGGDEVPRMKSDYQKIQLVPFGETIPYLDLIPNLVESLVGIGTFTRGQRTSPLSVSTSAGPLLVGPSVCFEDLIPWLHRRHARNGTQLFINMTNDAWYDPLPGSTLHLAAARWRCIETGIPMIRATNTGRSVYVGGSGEVLEELPSLEKQVGNWTVEIRKERTVTFYSRAGDWFGWLAFGTVLGMFLAGRRRSQAPATPSATSLNANLTT